MFITILLAGMTLSIASILVLQFESTSPNGNITTGGDAIWWGIVTITTVGYGDFYPVTMLGRLTAIFVMFAGIGIIGALASILASLLVSPGTPEEPAAQEARPAEPGEPVDTAAPPEATPPEAATMSAVVAELAALRAEVMSLRETLAADG